MPQNLERFYGFGVNIDNSLTPAEYEVLEQFAHELARIHSMDRSKYVVYFHTLRLTDVTGEHFGFFGDISERILKLIIEFQINQKQRAANSIRFFNAFITNENLPEHAGLDILPSYSDHVVEFHFPGKYFAKKLSFRSALVTFVDRSINYRHQKIKAKVSVIPTKNYAHHITNIQNRVAQTNLDISLRKSVQLLLPMDSEMKDKKGTIESTVNNNTFIVRNAGAVGVYANSSGSVNYTENESAMFFELAKLLVEMSADKTASVQDLEIIRHAASADDRKNAIEWLSSASQWTLEKAEKLGLSIAASAIKEAFGISS